MFDYGVAATYDLANSNGELLLMLLISFGLGALFGRTLLAQSRAYHRAAMDRNALPPATNRLPAVRSEDDLRQIPGIGPRVAEVLQARGIRTFAQLAQASPERLQAILSEASVPAAGVRTWPMMAAFLAAQKIAQS